MGVETFRLNDVDAALEFGAKYFAIDHRVEPIGQHGSFWWEVAAGRLPGTTIGSVGYGIEVDTEIRGTDETYSVILPTTGGLDMRFGGAETSVIPGLATIVPPVECLNIHGFAQRGDRTILFRFDQPVLEAELGRLLGREVVGPIRFEPVLDFRAGRGRQWWDLVQLLVSELRAPVGLAFNPLLSASLSSALMSGLLLATDHQFRDALESAARPERPPMIQRAMNLIEEHAHEPITIPGIASEVGTSVRALQLGFNKYVGVSPGRFVARVRLERAHSELIMGTPETVLITEVAARWGFSNPGRFAGMYRAMYGVAPSVTLRER